MFTVHATKKLFDRVKAPPLAPVAEPSTVLGNWYATALFWKPQVALFVNEATMLPVLVALAPADKLLDRFPAGLARVLAALGIDEAFTAAEVAASTDATYAKTANRSVVGVMTEFAFLAEVDRDHRGGDDLTGLSVRLSGTPCGPLYQRHVSPDQETIAFLGAQGSEPG